MKTRIEYVVRFGIDVDDVHSIEEAMLKGASLVDRIFGLALHNGYTEVQEWQTDVANIKELADE